jgi:hypothetical protein
VTTPPPVEGAEARPGVLVEILGYAVLPLVGGVGMIASRKWGWTVSLVAAAAGILFGVAMWFFSLLPDADAEDIEWTWLTFLALPAAAALAALLAPATIQWLRASSHTA